jgi:ribosome biogenesis protein Nip4
MQGPLDDLKAFMKGFGVEIPKSVVVKGRRLYLAPDAVKTLVERTKAEPFSIGLPLGESTHKGFAPSVALLDFLKPSENRIVITDEAEWLFTCGRDVLPRSILENSATSNPFLVVNARGEVVGIGRRGRKDKGEDIVENVLDRGDFLRREEHRKKNRRSDHQKRKAEKERKAKEEREGIEEEPF